VVAPDSLWTENPVARFESPATIHIHSPDSTILVIRNWEILDLNRLAVNCQSLTQKIGTEMQLDFAIIFVIASEAM